MIQVRPARGSDLEIIAMLASEHSIKSKSPAQCELEGFLVSGFSVSAYMNWLPFIAVAEKVGQICGFTLAFRSAEVPRDMPDVEQLPQIATLDDFLLIKQVAVDRAQLGCGVGRALYRDLIERNAGLPIYAPVLLSNKRSIRFHETFGFHLSRNFLGRDGSQRGLFLLVT